jgi:hypothetical protein
MSKSVAEFAHEYFEMGWRMCPIAPGSKTPLGKGWQVTPAGPSFWDIRPSYGMGLIHSLSNTCCLDIDHMANATKLLTEYGIDLEELLEGGVQIKGHPDRAKLIYRTPEGFALGRKALSVDKVIAFELRAGNTQDVLPPSIHPTTQAPYAWVGDYTNIPVLPDSLHKLWVELSQATANAQAAKAKEKKLGSSSSEEGIIDQYNECVDVGEVLERNGYVPYGSRWLAPGSTSNLPGVCLLPAEPYGRVFSHHGSDLLSDGFSHSAFSVFCLLEHGNDVSAAVKAAVTLFSPEENDLEVQLIIEEMLADTPKAPTKAPKAHKAKKLSVMEPPAPAEPVAIEGEDEEEDVVHIHEYLDAPDGGWRATEVSTGERPWPPPCPLVEEMCEYFADKMVAPKVDAIIQASLSFSCFLTSRRFLTPKGRNTNNYLGIMDSSTVGHVDAKAVFFEAMDACGDVECVQSSSISSSPLLHRELYRSPRLMWVTTELGAIVRIARVQQSGAHQSALSGLMEAFNCSTMYASPSAVGSQGQNLSKADCRILYPSLSMLSYVSYSDLATLANKGEYAKGVPQQICFVDAGESISNHRPNPLREIPANVQAMSERLANLSPFGRDMANATFQPTSVKLSKGASQMFDLYYRKMLDMMSSPAFSAWRGMAVGYTQVAWRIATSLSALNNPTKPLITAEVAEYACEWVTYCLAGTLTQLETHASYDTVEQELEQRILEVLRKNAPKTMTERDLLKSCRPLRNLSPEDRQVLLCRLAEDGDIRKLEPKGGRRGVGYAIS